MVYPIACGQSKIEIEKSKFISELFFIKTPAEVKPIVKKLWQEHPQARHIVYAFVCGKSGEVQGKSDDGEPANTAGAPTLDAIKSFDATATLVATVRYFGGIKLGTGGLSRAYFESARGTLANSSFSKLEEKSKIFIKLPYSLFDSFATLLSQIENDSLKKESEDFCEEVKLEYIFPTRLSETLEKKIVDFGNGKLKFKIETLPLIIE